MPTLLPFHRRLVLLFIVNHPKKFVPKDDLAVATKLCELDLIAAVESLIKDQIIGYSEGWGGRYRVVKEDAPEILESREKTLETLHREIILAHLPEDGSPKGNITLRRECRLEKEEYDKVRSSLVDDGTVGVGAGKGGSIYRIIETPREAEEGQVQPRQPENDVSRVLEKDLYKPFLSVVQNDMAQERRFNRYPFVAEETAYQRNPKGGRYQAPDITIALLKSYLFVPRRDLEIICFELKRDGAWDESSVLEAAGHTRFAHHCYLAIQTSYPEVSDAEKEKFQRVLKACRNFKVGLLTFSKVEDYETYEFHLQPQKADFDPDPDEIDLFIKWAISPEGKERLQRLLNR